jgi:Spy/CpxP family protein refolding chaperone
MKKTLIGIAAGVMVLGMAGLALAVDSGPGGFGGPEDPGVKGEAMRARFIAKMQDKLGLDDATTAKIIAIFKKYRDQGKDLRASMKKDVAALKEILDTPKFDETKLTPILDRMADTRTKLQALRDSEMKEVRTLLTPTQQAKAVIQMAAMKDKMKKRFHHGPKGDPEGGPDGE